MPEMLEQMSGSQDIEKCLDFLEDYSLTTYQSRCENYQKIQCSFSGHLEIRETVARRLLEVCIHDLKKDMKYAGMTLAVIAQILKKIKEKQCPKLPELVSSALAVLHLIKTTALITKVQTLQSLSFETFLGYPDETYIALATNYCSEFTELFNLYLHQGIPAHLRIMAFKTLHAVLKSLPPEKKKDFVKEGLNVWFSKVIPSTMGLLVTCQNADVSITLDVMDLLTAELEHIEYSDNTQWMYIMDCIYSPQKYPTVMKNLLESGDQRWHCLWIMFVKLLKQQITVIKPKIGSPINSMLPVVEAAFKLDTINRCHAFKCWRVLIDNFSAETNENLVNKRIKLLIIPLKSNNAKVEETALAKFDTWWHLIKKYESRLETHMDVIFTPFLQFCFGNPKYTVEKNILVPGQLSLELKKQSLWAFVESAGHIDCTGCVPEEFPKMTKGVLNPKILQDSLPQWILALKSAIKISGLPEYNGEEGRKQICCIWRSFLSVSSRLPEGAKKDVVGKLLTMVTGLVEERPDENRTLDIVFDIVLKSFLEDTHTRNMLDRVTDTQTAFSGLTLQILDLITSSTLQNYYDSMEAKEAAAKLRPFTRALLDDCLGPASVSVALLLKQMPTNDVGLLLWMALTEPVRKMHGELTPDVLKKVLLWTLGNMGHLKNLKHAAVVWNKTYNLLRAKFHDTTMQQDMIAILTKSDTVCDLSIFALLHAIKNDYDREYKKNFKLDLPMLSTVLSKQNFVDCYNKEEIFRLAVDTSAMMLSRIGEVMDNSVTELALDLAKRCFDIFVENENIHANGGCVTSTEKVLVQLKRICKIIATVQLESSLLIEKLLTSYTMIKLESAKNLILEILKIYLANSKEKGSPLMNKVREFMVTQKKAETPNQKVKFVAPDKSAKKKKKGATILNTVVENGEEYVVINPNWKFSPRKLTEHQKERLQRKREDIPALYQDLSQSQDEFKLQSWKPDSQDTSASSSNTTTSASKTDCNNAVVMLQKMPSTEVVSKIMENIFSDKVTSDTIANDQKNLAVNENVNSNTESPKPVKMLSLGPIKPKSTRVALKDRVFQNVKNLMEKSSVPSETKSAPKDLNKTLIEFAPKTPISKTSNELATVSSAPPKISLERPSRMKRKPRKLTDFTELSLKRKKRSLTVNESQNDQESEDMSDSQNNTSMISDDDIANTENKKLDSAIELKSKEKKINKIGEARKETVAPEKLQEPEKSKEPEIPLNTTLDPDATRCDIIVTEDNNDKESKNSIKLSNIDTVKIKVVNDDVKIKTNPETIIDIKETPFSQNEEETLSQDIEASSVTTDKVANVCLLGEKSKESCKATAKKPKKSRIEKELAIDMVEGHPLFRAQPDTRLRKSVIGVISTRRKALSEKINKVPQSDSKLEIKPKRKQSESPKDNNDKVVKTLFSAKNSQEKDSFSSNELPEAMSEDFIESSQDSTFTTVSVISHKKTPKVVLENMQVLFKGITNSPEKINVACPTPEVLVISPEKEDIEFSRNKSVEPDLSNNTVQDLTADCDTEPMDSSKFRSSDVIIINDDPEPVNLSTEDTYIVSTQSQVTANADTQPNDSKYLSDMDKRAQLLQAIETTQNDNDECQVVPNISVEMDTQEVVELPISTTDVVIEEQNESGMSSPFKDEEQRNKDFLNDTLEISPIKSLSPIQDDKTPTTPEKSSDYLVVKLSSPVQCDGEPFEKSGSPEIFTDDKVSPDKRDVSPPRAEIIVNPSSPSLSLKKNKPQRRQGGRAAQMLGLCVPDMHNVMNVAPEKFTDPDEVRNTVPTAAKRNLRILYNCESNDTNINENEESDKFLKFKKTLPTADCSPSGPILKRKLIDIADDATISPASKRKRVSFHDPPVSTTISVQKYIEPLGIRSPQSSLTKKQDRQQRSASMKSPKKLENMFKLDTALTKTVESFIDPNISVQSEDMTMNSLEQTLLVEIVKAGELNDTDPICPELIHCTDPINLIAADLSSPAMKTLFIKELQEKIQSIGDLAKMTELEVNRLCIKAPKVKIAKKVLYDYVAIQDKESQIVERVEEPIETEITDIPSELEMVIAHADIEVQTDEVSSIDTEMQTDVMSVVTVYTQTKTVNSSCRMVQTNETGSKTTQDIVSECLKEKPDFVNVLADQLDDACKMNLIASLPLASINEVLSKKLTDTGSSSMIMDSLLKNEEVVDKNGRDSFLQNYLLHRYDNNELILLCSQLLKKVHEKSS